MKSFDWLFHPFVSYPSINPASALPMIGDSGLDVGGNPFGTDWSSGINADTFSSSTHCDPFPSTSTFDSIECGSSFDSFGSHSCD